MEKLTFREINQLQENDIVQIEFLNNPISEYRFIESTGDTFSRQFYFQSTCEEVYSLKVDDSDLQDGILNLAIYK